MTTTDTLNEMILTRLDRAQALRAARVAAARTNLDLLIAQGVVVTCDDEYENAMRWRYTAEQAKEAGVPHNAMADALDYVRLANAVVDELYGFAFNGEIPEQHAARLHEAVAKLPTRVAPGRKSACKHNDTQRERGLVFCGGDRDGNERHVCCRCGLEVVLPSSPPEPTDAAVEAARLVLRLSNDQQQIDLVKKMYAGKL